MRRQGENGIVYRADVNRGDAKQSRILAYAPAVTHYRPSSRTHCPWAIGLFALMCGLALLATPRARANEPPPPLPPPTPEQQARVLALVADAGRFKLVGASPQGYQLGLTDETGRTIGVMSLETQFSDPALRFHSRSFAIRIGNMVPDQAVVETLIKAARLVAERDDGSWAPPPPPVEPAITSWWDAPGRAVDPDLTDFTMVVIVVAALLGLWRRGKVSWAIKLPHLLPAAIQVVLFCYWGLYWTAIRDHLPTLLTQLVLGFALDAFFAFARFGSWRIGASPFPIVLSSNLFAWFNTTGTIVNLVVAFASKTYIHRQGRHIFNPSSLGLATAGILAVAFPEFIGFGGVFHTMNIPPNMMELVVLLSILPQSRFRIVPVSIAAIAALQYQGIPGSLRPSMLLAIALLATDPATIPRTDLGKIFFGVFLGFAMPFTSLQLRALGSPDDFSKVIPIPIANALGPAFDALGGVVWGGAARLGAMLRARLKQLASQMDRLGAWRIPDRGMIAIWLLFVVPGMWKEKPATFEPTMLWTMGTPHVIRDADDVPRCEHNPLFCRPFSFAQEVVAWAGPPTSTGPAIPTYQGIRAPVVQAPPP